MKVLLVNPNLMRPPVSPVALDLLADSLARAGFSPVVLDLSWSEDIEAELERATREDFLFAAVSVRNIDDSFFPGSDECLDSHGRIVRALRSRGVAVAAGGVGFSIAPEEVAHFLGADYCVAGDGEEAVVALARALSGKGKLKDVPGLGTSPPARVGLFHARPPSRTFVDNPRYLREGGQVGFETKRGCPCSCAACADPLAKGKAVRARDPKAVCAELKSLVAQGVDVLHTCDCEFNVPHEHAEAVCEELVRSGLAEKLRWYAYCTPAGFDYGLARLMRRAGSAGVDFAADHGEAEMLRRLKSPHTVKELRRAAEACRKAGLRFMFDLLLGSPGETRESIRRTIELMRELSPTRVGVALGVRLYRGCSILEGIDLSRERASIHAKSDDPTFLRPTYYREASLGDDVEEWLEDLIGGDGRFFYAASSHNYDGNARLCELIREGARGAFWDILARAAGD